MPILIRIVAQRAILGIGAVLGFFGLAPDVVVPDQTQIIAIVEDDQKNIVEKVVQNTPEITPDSIINTIDAATSIVNNEIQRAPTNPINPPQTPVDIQTIQETIQQEIEQVVREVIPSEKIEPLPIKPEVEKVPPKTVASSRNIENVLVNIICTYTNGNATTASTGSGVIVSSSGVVLTNAHVAQYFLLRDWSRPNYMNCALYQKNNPALGYRADVLYIQPEWVKKNYDTITSRNPRGTGEDDYAFLIITGSANFSPAATRFSYAQINTDESVYEIGQSIQVGGFPGAPSSILELSQAGNLETDNTEISNVFTLARKSVDIISTGSTPVAQRGSSGGGAFYDGELIGITVTTSGSGKNAKINALTTGYIDRDLRSDLGTGLSAFISGDVRGRSARFIEEELPALAELLGGQF